MKKLVAAFVVLVSLAAGGWLYLESKRPTGFVLISIDTLRADHLGAYGYPLDTSPFFDELAARGTLFENAIVQLPGTLPSHMSIFTSLYPAEHGVYPPDSVLSPDIPTLPEIFRSAGYRTAGFTEGGYVAGRYGFARGFDTFRDENTGKPGAAGRTFALAKEWVSALEPGEKFFLFIHTYEVHDPYMPMEGYNSWPGPVPDVWEPNGANLTAASLGRLPVPSGALEYFVALYDAGIRYVDDELRAFMEHLWAARLARDTTVVITSDHGEEFLEHGSFVHRQIYNETLHVPLLVRRLGQRRGGRVSDLVQSIDIAPTLLELAGIEAKDYALSGRSLTDLLAGSGRKSGAQAFAEGLGPSERTVYRQTEDGLYQFLLTRFEPRGGRVAVRTGIVFDWPEARLELQAAASGSARDLSVRVNGQERGRYRLEPDSSVPLVLDLAPEVRHHRVELAVDDCEPLEHDASGRSCVGFFLEGLVPERRELYRLDRDPLAATDLSAALGALSRDLEVALEGYQWQMKAKATREELTDDEVEQLKALGYLQ